MHQHHTPHRQLPPGAIRLTAQDAAALEHLIGPLDTEPGDQAPVNTRRPWLAKILDLPVVENGQVVR